ncbi:hypothetical protein [Alloalcanivorax xenomutans]|uniref:Integrating conjugative element protein n=1 Tax=Alloalcanivorax xenomutans TaxID=1094342 RepID=A0A9Q3WAG0_9GAMM|nr:hypothetical protein [Alloalcanivorax xenomutans]MCE7511332.1 hypothetical protein [Alloalcanivorax xenomutans]
MSIFLTVARSVCPNNRYGRRAVVCVMALWAVVLSPHSAQAESADSLYYQIGGASPVAISAGRGHQPGQIGLGLRWNANARCGNFDPKITVRNQLNGATDGFRSMMGNIVRNAQGAVASLPAMIIQRADPGLYDLVTNGVLQGKADFSKAKLSCQQMAEKMGDMIPTSGWQRRAVAENWQLAAMASPDAVRAEERVEDEAGNRGTTWVGGEKRGGSGQAPIRVMNDTATAGYNILHGRTNTTDTSPVSGGGGGWGSVPTDDGNWAGGGGNAGAGGGGSACRGGMCTVWGSPQEAAQWISKVAGEEVHRTCDGCEKVTTEAGAGLMRDLEDEQEKLAQDLANMVNGSTPTTPENLRKVSAGPGLSVSRGVIEALKTDPEGPLLIHRLAGEMALARTLTKAIWARRLLLAGASEPGISDNEEGQTAIDRRLQILDRDIDSLQTEMEVRQALARNAASTAILRRSGSARTGAPESGDALPDPLDQLQ